jgi:hypothetical protein
MEVLYMAQFATDTELELLSNKLKSKLYNYNSFKRFLIKSAAEGESWAKTIEIPLETWCRKVIQEEFPELSDKLLVVRMDLVEMRDSHFVIPYHDWHRLFLRALGSIKAPVITAEQALDILNKVIELFAIIEPINELHKKAESEETLKKEAKHV